MKEMKWSASALVLSLVMTSGLTAHSSRADLVLDDEGAQDVASAKETTKVEERESTRKVVRKSQQVEVSQELIADPVVSAQAQEPVTGDVDYANRSELLRRKRMREEMKNEDLLQQRLEELRLRDEEKRTKKVMKNTGLDEETAEADKKKEVAPIVVAPVLQEELVVAPVTETPARSYQMNPAPVSGVQTHDQIIVKQSSTAAVVQAEPANFSPAPTYETDHAASGYSKKDQSDLYEEKSESVRMTIAPRFGLLTMSSNAYNLNAKFAAGIGVGFEATDQIAVELGFTYAETGINSPYAMSSYMMNPETMTFKQNIFDIGMKFYLTESSSRIRPFVGVGAGYSLGYLNYSNNYQSYYYSNTSDYQLKSFLGILQAGLDFKVSEKISVGAAYKYINALSSSQNDSIDNRGFYPYGYSGYGTSYDPVKLSAGNSLRGSNMQLVTIGATFGF